ncbi:hypothetical protein BFR57_07530 [Idiomarina sp. MD25a]|uniref:amidohydrolase family protein n=1 Tax=Idiomarina sp. MD25a TaxID=1889913 RepID=UPI0008F8EC18|nr:amidohydrolase family protein [Idiomarina sp. MD25a]OIN01898.1 hypothetical protein BFR57_07530 [Idiomarina sp. MD25a]
MSKLTWIIGIVVVAALLWLLPEPAPVEDNSFVVGPINVFDGESVLQAHYVSVEEGVIVRVGSQPPNANQRVYPTKPGQWLIPGLIDSHVHAWGKAREQALDFGVTTVIDLFGHPTELAKARQQRSSVQLQQEADMWGAGRLVTAPEGHGTQFGFSPHPLADDDSAEEAVSERIAEGSDFIKIVYTAEGAAYPHRPSISYQQLQRVIQAAHAQQVLAVVHVADHLSAEQAVAAGADGLVHGFFDKPMSEELIDTMEDSQVFIVPTNIIYEHLVHGEFNKQVLLPACGDCFNQQKANNLSSGGGSMVSTKFYNNLKLNTRLLDESGIDVLVGSDAPNPGTAHGISLIAELMWLEAQNVNWQVAINSATALAASRWRINNRGRLAVGQRADMVLIDSSPEQGMHVLLEPQAVWKNGYRVR